MFCHISSKSTMKPLAEHVVLSDRHVDGYTINLTEKPKVGVENYELAFCIYNQGDKIVLEPEQVFKELNLEPGLQEVPMFTFINYIRQMSEPTLIEEGTSMVCSILRDSGILTIKASVFKSDVNQLSLQA